MSFIQNKNEQFEHIQKQTSNNFNKYIKLPIVSYI